MKNLKIISFALILIFPIIAFSQQNNIDSLLSLVKEDKQDTNKVIHLNKLSWKFINIGYYDTALYYSNSALQLAQQLNFKKEIGTSLGYIGVIYRCQSDYPKALEYNFKALKISQEIEDKEMIARHLGNIGTVYKNQSNYSKAIEYYFNALKIDEELGNNRGVATHLSNIGPIYFEKHDYDKALYYCLKALKIGEKIGYKSLISINLLNIGAAYSGKGDYDKSLDYYHKALKIAEELGDKNSISVDLGNIGQLYSYLKRYKDAYNYSYRALVLSNSIGANNYVQFWYNNLSELYEQSNIPLPDSTGGKLLTMEQMRLRSLYYYKRSIAIRDTLFSEENKKQLVQKEMNFEFDKKEAVTKAETEKQQAEQKIITASVTGGLLLVLLFAGFIGRSLRTTKKQKLVIEKQKHLVEEHQKEITASITYAKRLQEAILPPLTSIKKQFPESFILYKPKDIVAGDFYWMETMDNIQFIAASDCTGHGVPGAMMSVVCSNALNRAVKEFGLRDTGTILDKVTDLVLETFEKSDSEVKDGMDISILAYNRKNNTIQWSGANNPLWYSQNEKIIEIKPDKQPIGQCDHRKAFTTHNIAYSKDSVFYLFTDGYADQFGGPKGKKFMYRKFQDNLSAICKYPLQEQENALQSSFNGWKGNLEQVDDVTIIGIKL